MKQNRYSAVTYIALEQIRASSVCIRFTASHRTLANGSKYPQKTAAYIMHEENEQYRPGRLLRVERCSYRPNGASFLYKFFEPVSPLLW